jgi:hypothetical protein
MSRFRTTVAAGCAAVALSLAASANAAIINGSFETGDFTGWTQNLSSGGYQGIVTGHAAYAPVHGNYFALFGAGTQDILSGISQTFTLHAGHQIQGWAFFDAGDYLPYNDIAKVEIFDSLGGLVATPFYADVAAVGDYGDGAWTYWQYTALVTGTYTVTMGVANTLDSGYHSYAGFDAISSTDPIPEPATLTLFALGLVGLGFARRRKA